MARVGLLPVLAGFVIVMRRGRRTLVMIWVSSERDGDGGNEKGKQKKNHGMERENGERQNCKGEKDIESKEMPFISGDNTPSFPTRSIARNSRKSILPNPS